MTTIQVLWDSREAGHIAPLQRAADGLQEVGYALTFAKCSGRPMALRNADAVADALLIHQELVSDDLLAYGLPVMIHERVDGAQLARSRQWIHRNEVRAVVKGYTYRDAELNNTSRGRRHATLLHNAGVKAAGKSMALVGRPKPQLSPSDLDKIKVGYGFASYDAMELFHGPVDWGADRPVPVMFAGWTDYKGSEIETHRRQAVQVAKDVGGIGHAGRPLPKPEYIHALDSSAAALSPWGWGEPCFRDYEAILRGCVLVKPDSRHVKAWPDIFLDERPVTFCNPDLSDVPKAVADATEARGLYVVQKELGAMRGLVIRAWQPESIAYRMAGIFREVL